MKQCGLEYFKMVASVAYRDSRLRCISNQTDLVGGAGELVDILIKYDGDGLFIPDSFAFSGVGTSGSLGTTVDFKVQQSADQAVIFDPGIALGIYRFNWAYGILEGANPMASQDWLMFKLRLQTSTMRRYYVTVIGTEYLGQRDDYVMNGFDPNWGS